MDGDPDTAWHCDRSAAEHPMYPVPVYCNITFDLGREVAPAHRKMIAGGKK